MIQNGGSLGEALRFLPFFWKAKKILIILRFPWTTLPRDNFIGWNHNQPLLFSKHLNAIIFF